MQIQRRQIATPSQPAQKKRVPSDKGAAAPADAPAVLPFKDRYRVQAITTPQMPQHGGYGNSNLRLFKGDDSKYRPFEGTWGPGFSLAGGQGTDLLVEPYNQGQAIDPETGVTASQQSCGTTSLAMLMNHLKPGSADQWAIDHEIRRSNKGSFTSPTDIVDYADRHGFRAAMTNNASVEDLARMIDQGVPVQVLMEPLESGGKGGPDPNDLGIHYTVVNGYTRGADGKVQDVIVSDPWGLHYKMPVADFEKHWGDLRLKGVSTGLNRLMITMVPQEGTVQRPDGKAVPASSVALPTAEAADPLWPATTLAGAAMDVRNAVVAPTVGQVVGGIASGLVKGVGGAIGWGLGAVGLGDLGGQVAHGATVMGDAIKEGAKAIEAGAKALWGALSSL